MDIHRLVHYTLDENKMPVPCDDPMEWHIWYSFADKHVAKDWVGPVMVSTVFLGLDFGFGLWETMVVGGRMDRYQARSDGRLAEALKMHERILELVKLAEELAPCLGVYDSLPRAGHASQPTAPMRKSLGALRATQLVLNCVHKIHQYIPRCFNRPVSAS